MIKVIVAGFEGKMGRQVLDLINKSDDFELVAGYAPHAQTNALSVKVYNELAAIPKKVADVWIDFSLPTSVYQNSLTALEKGIRPVIGTTGLQPEQISSLQKIANQQKLGALLVPNFSLSAVLMIKLAKQAVQYFPEVEIIELHNARKVDAPSGTAKYTATQLAGDKEIPIHSVRLPGYIAHQEILFGGIGEALTIRQDSFDRSSFMPGVALAIRKIMHINQFVTGLENILE
ncbi:4-hydroxy-tetrahydrodipicolinate reductase [Periweissella beninensis]|uniref:4-hydroxy-tetrahydrodipicolinate reductase n=1 Tax=Periweissella beninensis TaxID=504936 RepID=A0ABT0VFK8_9LACO|nr:4-hydroxy-tetrahydrodipicolinate reductase [Periweissella beninensis]MBM7543504.1 4-hydroxy-tetrahydrodipicolinate reductase [Periweissella beninensis]MCM2436486.1 4-hydroxy-tetrahydrodipicolinate reductase [Periweissella beninensis]MCT4396204.1 4-hydroxy-tetrahydrodipicolinate reductase [Periweissella beninensis]